MEVLLSYYIFSRITLLPQA